MIQLFISYAREDQSFLNTLVNHLSALKRDGLITWTDRELVPGQNFHNKISQQLKAANIILFIVSADFLASDYCNETEMKTALQRNAKNETILIPIVARHCDWRTSPLGQLQALPYNAVPIIEWEHRDKAYLDIVDGIKSAINHLQHPSRAGKQFKLAKYSSNSSVDPSQPPKYNPFFLVVFFIVLAFIIYGTGKLFGWWGVVSHPF